MNLAIGHIGYPKECKSGEKRYLLSKDALRELLKSNIAVHMETGGGIGIGYSDDVYMEVAREMGKESLLIVHDNAEEIYQIAQLIVMVKEPQRQHLPYFRDGQTIFSYLHLTGEYDLVKEILDLPVSVNIIALETITSNDPSNPLPLLQPMSVVAGKQAVSYADAYMQTDNGGLGKFPQDCHATIIGMGNSGMAALLEMANKYGSLTLIENNQDKRHRLINFLSPYVARGAKFEVLDSNDQTIRNSVLKSNVVIDGVLGKPGAKAPKLISQDLLIEWGEQVKDALFVTISIDQGSIIEDIEATSIAEPMREYNGVRVIAVPNMPGTRAYSASNMLAPLVAPHVINMAQKGVVAALKDDEHLRNGLNISGGKITMPGLLETQGVPKWARAKYKDVNELLGIKTQSPS